MELTPEQDEFRQVVRHFAAERIAPHAETWDREHTFPTDVVLEMGELGLFGLLVPERWGGSGADLVTLCLAIEEIGRADQSLGITLEAAALLGAEPIHRFGSDAQKERWLPDLAAGRALAAFGLTEPDGGSDVFATTTRAEHRDGPGGGQWVLNGTKAFITNSGTPITSLITVTAPARIMFDRRVRLLDLTAEMVMSAPRAAIWACLAPAVANGSVSPSGTEGRQVHASARG